MTAINAVLAANPKRLTKDNTVFVFDIDDTIVFSGLDGDDDRDTATHPCQNRTPHLRTIMKRLVSACQRFGRVFFVTAREARKDVARYTDEELRRAGFSQWEEVYYCPKAQRKTWITISDFKRNARRDIERKKGADGRPLGFKVVLTAGDKWSDSIATRETLELDRKEAGKPWFTITPVIDPKQHTMLALKLPSRE